VTSDVLTSVKKMEDSLKRLKKVRGTDKSSGNQGMSDDDKIRQQLILDITNYGEQVRNVVIKIHYSIQATSKYLKTVKVVSCITVHEHSTHPIALMSNLSCRASILKYVLHYSFFTILNDIYDELRF